MEPSLPDLLAGGFAALDRRAFLATAGRCGFWALVASVAGPRGVSLAASPRTPTPGFPVEGVSAEARTVAAVIETIVPGAATDAEGGPGALEAGALNLVYDAFYPVRPYLAPMVALLDAQARQRHGAPFAELAAPEREALLASVQETLPFLRHAWRFVRGVFFADLHDATGSTWLGFPGPNLGYVDHPEFSFRRALSDEETRDGNLP